MTASLELSKRLYELSGWESGKWFTMAAEDEMSLAEMPDVPQYDCGYLLRKLPNQCSVSTRYTAGAEATYMQKEPWIMETADTPEDALCKLAIKLFEEKIL